MMHGEIGVSSTMGEGSTFWFTLELDVAGEQHVVAVKPNFSVEQKKFPNKHILVAEDVETNQFVITTMLRSLGCTYDIANNGQEAVDAVKKRGYDCVLMDCMMPVMDGYDATRIIRESGYVNLPIFALTANALADDRKKGMEAGMDDYLSKPIVKDDIIKVFSKIFAGK
jgi:CheY-like chemotaxis protein